MIFHMMKSGFVILLAMVFSASQLCACMSPMGVTPAEQHQHQAPAMEMGDHADHQTKDTGHDRHGGETGCSHCSAPSLLEAALAAKFTTTLSHPEFEKFVPSALALTDNRFGKILPMIARGHAWLDPPPTTPITLKTRLLN